MGDAIPVPAAAYDRPYRHLSDDELLAKRSELVDDKLVRGVPHDEVQLDLACVQVELCLRQQASNLLHVYTNSFFQRYFLDENNLVAPIRTRDDLVWNLVQAMDHPNRRQVGDDTHLGFRVSTVFLGEAADERLGFFETMIFDVGNGDYKGEFETRYATWHEAERGHEIIVKTLCDSFTIGEALERLDEILEDPNWLKT